MWFSITLCIAFGSFRTFGRWKREQIEERKLDGALEALSIAYEAQMVFEDIQRPFIGQHEWQNMPNGCELVGVVDASGLGTRPPLTSPTGANRRLRLDTFNGRRSAFWPCSTTSRASAWRSPPGLGLVRELGVITAGRGRPAMCMSENVSGLTGMAAPRLGQDRQVDWHYIARGKLTKNALSRV